MSRLIKKVSHLINDSISKLNRANNEATLLAIGAMLSKQQCLLNSNDINDYEFKIFSQFGDDGIIQYLIKNIEIKNEIFIEFGVENYLESNTRFLMMNNNWTGFVMDGSDKAMKSLENQSWYWQYNLTQKAVFIDKANINALLESTGFSDIGLLHIDLDGNDYHILKEIEMSRLNPSIIIMEYNSVFGKDRQITVPYDKHFDRTKAHFSNLFFGASLPALNNAAVELGYILVCCNLAGNNAYFVRKDLLNEKIKEESVEKAYKESKFRESRNKDYSLSYIAGSKRLEAIRGLKVLNIETNQLELL
ncbi:hypothetical protein FVR03_23285 [Pontibacter qinzhouensis]|uniref:Methyltransferase FkbM domain-containing protein n=1 Tax=Pontibacter qinzhouensis TaxID=2603253 RepID=A0A5C8IKW7_9BACT|nr:FkbM family methyltransferase [Pontibacter qinzhouensis]TXK21616.1 hypothetical protein FVR03_23285 [Pontibacter qinzhouensis]